MRQEPHVRQFNFPNTFSEIDQLVSADHDNCLEWDHDHTSRCFTQHTGKGDLCFEGWIMGKATDEQVFAFLIDILKQQDKNISWTGFCVSGVRNLSTGYMIWSLQLFAKHPDSRTLTYSKRKRAPRVLHH